MSEKTIDPNELIAGFMGKLAGNTEKAQASSGPKGPSAPPQDAPTHMAHPEEYDIPPPEYADDFNEHDDVLEPIVKDEVENLEITEDTGAIAKEAAAKPQGLEPDVKKRIKIILAVTIVALVVYLGLNGSDEAGTAKDDDPLAAIYAADPQLPGDATPKWDVIGEDRGVSPDLLGQSVAGEDPLPLSANPEAFVDIPKKLPAPAAPSPGADVSPQPPQSETPTQEKVDANAPAVPFMAAASTNRLSAQTIKAVQEMDERLMVAQDGVAAISKQVGSVQLDLQQQSVILGRVEQRVNEVADTQSIFNQLSSKRDTEATERPDLELLLITQTTECDICAPYARIRHMDKEYDISVDDTFNGYTVEMKGDRLILRNSKAHFSYYANH
jgi:hypothetical protein